MSVRLSQTHCPVCGELYIDYEKVYITNPGAGCYNIEVFGKTYRQLGISGRGEWTVYRCARRPEERVHVWADLVERYT